MIALMRQCKCLYRLALVTCVAGGAASELTGQDLVLSELLAANVTGRTDEDGEHEPWIELSHCGAETIHLDGFGLTDDPGEPFRWRFPEIDLQPGEHLVVVASGKDRHEAGRPLHTNFSLAPGGAYLGLYAPGGTTAVWEFAPAYPPQRRDISYGLDPVGGTGYLVPPTPGAENTDVDFFSRFTGKPRLDPVGGFYDKPFAMEITSVPRARVYYTIDGSEPTPQNGTLAVGSVVVDHTTILRAAAFAPGEGPSAIATRSYLFLDEVLTARTLDPRVIEDPRYAGRMRPALRAVPTLSLVGPELLIRAALAGRLDAPISMELFDPRPEVPPEEALLQIDCGLEGHSDSAPKQSYRLEFRRELGPSKLRFPIFRRAPLHGESAVEEFDRLVLRGGNDLSWHTGGQRSQTTFVRDQWVRDSQLAMSGIGSHGTFVHLYLNGSYRGLYNVAERPDAWFTSSYVGGKKTDWFATNHQIERGGEYLSGNGDRFERLVMLAREGGLQDPERYAQVLSLLDLERYIDYVILYWYAGVGDGLDNNWYAGMRTNPPGRLMFFMWDAEYSWLNASPGPASHEGAWVPSYFFGAEYARTTIITIWQALLANPEFRVTFADRIHKHCFAGGALTEENALARLRALTAFVEEAVLGESARWGRGFTLDEHWRPAVAALERRVEGNVARFLRALRAAPHRLYPKLDAPGFRVTREVSDGSLHIELRSLDSTAAANRVYFTTDGSDPREPWTGRVSPTAFLYVESLRVEGSVLVRARSQADDQWSALTEARFGPATEPANGRLLPGDLDVNGVVNLTDAVALLRHLFAGESTTLPCTRAVSAPGGVSILDTNGSGRVDLADATHLLAFLFRKGVPHVLGTECIAVAGCSTPICP